METDFNDLWNHVARDIIELETNGIFIDEKINIKGTIAYLSADNLGANASTGFVESFSGTNFCRFCTASKKETETMLSETKLRTVYDYEKQLQTIAESTKPDFKQTMGVKRFCSLNKLEFFHILHNPSVDIMHDLNEGAIPLTLKLMFTYCIKEKIFSEDWLKNKIQFHDFGSDKKNAPSTINLKKHNLNQSATQVLNLFRNIGFILIEYEQNHKLNEFWKLIQALQHIVQISYSVDIRESDLDNLEKNVYILLKGIFTIQF